MHQTSLPMKIIGAVVGGVMFLGLWAFFAPPELGGSTTYAVTSGISMQPLLHKGDLAFVRTQSSYHVGDIVLYQSQVLHRPVLHRIILIQNGNYFFKGDNNDFVDPGYATQSELSGTLWFHVDSVGATLTWFGDPLRAALLAGLATVMIALTGITTTKGRRHRRRGTQAMSPLPRPTNPLRASTRRGSIATETGTSSQDASARRPEPYLEGPAWTLVTVGVVGLVALLLLAMGFGAPTQRSGVLPAAYRQTGTFSYSARARVPNAVYANGKVKTGDPIFPSLIDTLSLRFGYRFASTLPHHITGTVELRALVLSEGADWQQLSTVAPVTKFAGDTTVVTTHFTLRSLYKFIDSVTTQTGVAGTNYSVDVQPVVRISGIVDGKPIDQKFSPVLPFAVSQTAIRIDAPAAAAPPGATYVPSSATSALSAVLDPIEVGAIPHVVANDVSVAKYKIPVSGLRTVGVALALLALVLALVHDRFRRRRARRSEEEHIAKRAHAIIVPVTALGSSPNRTPIVVPDFSNLANLASFLERPILYEVSNGTRTYAVDDETLRYVTAAIDRRQRSVRIDSAAEPLDREPPSPEPEPEPKPESPKRRLPRARSGQHATKGAMVARGAAVLVALGVVTTLTLSFTAGTTVPTSRVSQTFYAGSVAQGTPAGCSSLSLNNLVTGSGTFSNNSSDVLILGTAGVDKITDTGSRNCIVGGGGKDVVTGTSTDYCIIGPTTGATYSKCTKKTQ
jgi:signal peptidase I